MSKEKIAILDWTMNKKALMKRHTHNNKHGRKLYRQSHKRQEDPASEESETIIHIRHGHTNLIRICTIETWKLINLNMATADV